MDSPEEPTGDYKELATDIVRRLLGSSLVSELAFRLLRCHETAMELRAIAPTILAVAKDRDQRGHREAAESSQPGLRLPTDRRVAIMNALDGSEQAIDSHLKTVSMDEEALKAISEREAIANPLGTVMQLLRPERLLDTILSGLPAIEITTLDELQFFLTYLRAKQRPPMAPYVSSALFARIVSDIEPTFRRLLQLTIHSRESNRYDGLGDPELEKAVNRAFGKGVTHWRQVVSKGPAGVSITAAITWSVLSDAWQRRNVILHRGGFIDQAAQRNLKGSELGELITVTETEVLDVIDLVAATRMALILGTWVEQEPDGGAEAAESLSVFTVEELRYGRWQLARGLAHVSEAFARSEEYRAECKVLGWLALEKGLGRDAIREPVSGWSTEGLPERFEHSRLILLHEDERAWPLMIRLLEYGQISDAWLTSPLFDRLRTEGWQL